jgi:hypothetical protein
MCYVIEPLSEVRQPRDRYLLAPIRAITFPASHYDNGEESEGKIGKDGTPGRGIFGIIVRGRL